MVYNNILLPINSFTTEEAMVARDPFSIPVVSCKQELEFKEDDDDDDDDRGTVVYGSGNGGGGSACFQFPGSGLPESELARPSPFLRKTFEMVDNPETDPIVSWGGGLGCSFVVWDPHGFAVRLLHKYFKHRNFSSFVRQLRTYGFRKVHLGRWEFANPGFQRGKKHLLKTIKRRRQGHNINRNMRMEKLKEEEDMLRLQILGLKQQQEEAMKLVVSMKERVSYAVWKQQQMVIFIAKLRTQSSFIQHICSKYKQRRIAKSDHSSTSSSSLDGMNPVHRSKKEDISGMQSEMDSIVTAESNYLLWEKIMEDGNV